MSSRSPSSSSGSTRRSGRLASGDAAAVVSATPVRRARTRPAAAHAHRSRSRSASRGEGEEEAGDQASEASADEEEDAPADDAPIRATRASAASAAPAAVASAGRIVVNLLTAPAPNAAEAADLPMSSGDDDEGDDDDEADGSPDPAAAAAVAAPASSSHRDTVDLMDDGSDGEGVNAMPAAAAAAAAAPVTAPAAEDRKRIDSSERKSATAPSVPPSPISTRRSSERKGGDAYDVGDEGEEEEEERFEFADLSTPARRYDAMMRNCPPKERLVRLIRLVARPAGSDEEGELVRDPLMVAKLYHGSSAKNLQRCSDFLRHFSKQPSCQAFLERLTDRKLKSYETSLRAYLYRTGGIAPIDFSSIASKLAASKPDSVAQRDREGFAPAYPNSVAAVVVDLVNVVLNACKFNPPGHFVHEQALDLADKLPKALGSLRRQLRLDEDEIVCFTCGNGDSDEDSARGVLMQCESCSLWYHQGCANVPVVPRDSWYCTRCVDQNPKLMLKRARQAAALYASVAGLDQSAKQRSFSPAPRTQSRNDGGGGGSATAAPSSDVDMTDTVAAAGSKRKLEHAPNSGSDAATKKARNEAAAASAATSRSQPKSGGGTTLRAASPVAASSASPPPAASASSGLDRSPPPPPRARASSPDGRWMRLQSLAIKDRTPGGGGLFNPVVDFGTDDAGATAAAASARAEDENDLRALRTQLDGAMRTLAASSERLVDLQEKQRVRARRAALAKAAQANQAATLQQLIDTLTAPVEPDVDAATMDAAASAAAPAASSNAASASSPAASASAPAAAAAAAGSGAAAPVPSGEDLAKRLASYRQRFVSLTRLVAQQKEELAASHASAAALTLHYDEMKSEAVAIHSQQQTRVVELESALATLKSHLVSERRARNLAADQCAAHQRLARRMVQRLDQTVVGSPIPAQFGTKLLAEVRQGVEKEMAANEAANSANAASASTNTAANNSHKRDVAAHAAAIYQLKQPETPASSAPATGTGTGSGLSKVSSPAHNHPLHRHHSYGHSHPHTPTPAPPSRQSSGLGGQSPSPALLRHHSGLQVPALHHQQSSGSAASAAASPAAAAAASSSSPSSSTAISQLVMRSPHLHPHLHSLYQTLSSYMSMPSEAARVLLEQQHAQLALAGVNVDLADLAVYFERQQLQQQQQPQGRHKEQSQEMAGAAAAAAASSPRNSQSNHLFGPSALTVQSADRFGGFPAARARGTGPPPPSSHTTTSSSQMNSQTRPSQPQQQQQQQSAPLQQAPHRHLASHPLPPASTTPRSSGSVPAASAPSNRLFGPSSVYTSQPSAHVASPSAAQPHATTNGGDIAQTIAQASTTMEGQQAQQQTQYHQRTTASSSEALDLMIPPLERPHSGSRPPSGNAISQPPTHSWSNLQRPPPPAPQHSRLPVQSSFAHPSAQQQMLPAPMLVPVTPPAAAPSTTTTTTTTNHPAAQSASQSHPSSASNTSPPPLLYPTGPAMTPASAIASAPASAAGAASAAAASPPVSAASRVAPPLLPAMPADAPAVVTDTTTSGSASDATAAAAPVAAPAAAFASPISPTTSAREDDSPPDLIAPAHTK